MTDETRNINEMYGCKAKNEKGVEGGIIDRGNPTSSFKLNSSLGSETKKRISAGDMKRRLEIARAKRAERALLKSVTICGRTFDLRKEPAYRRNYLIRLSELQTEPLKAIKLKCLECSAYSADESHKCNAPDCALWVVLQNRKNRRKVEA